ncbi:hypothetical protein TL16_g06340 [Triparma laevis f. inornata]|uniref:Protein kinase domain-containing protein n=1 Tax=Triparma laevis f. inornata TaxID=1714386 RepID=A0A9W7ECS6_9STRA|nr:hypothetical protein TL16_g06340 [Triparma laevis f. inornata]
MSKPLSLSSHRHEAVKLTNADSTRLISDEYSFGKVIGHGASSLVRAATHKTSNETFAIKCIMKHEVLRERRLLSELLLLRKLKHPNIVPLHDIFETDTEIFLVMTYCCGGELFDRVSKKTYSERDASEVIYRLLSALDYLHSKGIIHRDVKPENILLESLDSDVECRLSDFGLARLLRVTELNKDNNPRESGGTFSPATQMNFARGFEGSLDKSGSFTNLGLVNDQSLSPNPPSFGSGSMSEASPDEAGGEKLPPKPPSFASRLSSRSSTEEGRNSPAAEIFSSSPMLPSRLGENLSSSPFGSYGTSRGDNNRTRLRSRAYTRVGSDLYTAPEVELGSGYGTAVDMWSLGVVLYILLCGFPPFDDGEYADVEFPDSHWSDISSSAKDLIRQLLVINDKARPTAREALQHEWIAGRQMSVSQSPFAGVVQEEMKRFNSKRRHSQVDGFGSFGSGSRSPMVVKFVSGAEARQHNVGSNLRHVVKRINGLSMKGIEEADESDRRSSLGENPTNNNSIVTEAVDFAELAAQRRSSGASALADALKTSMDLGVTPGGIHLVGKDGVETTKEGWKADMEDDLKADHQVEYGRGERFVSTESRMNSTDSQANIPQFRLTSVDESEQHERSSLGRRNIFRGVFRKVEGRGDGAGKTGETGNIEIGDANKDGGGDIGGG